MQTKKVQFAFWTLSQQKSCTQWLEGRGACFHPAAQALASALQINTVLTHLRIHGNDVGAQGAQAHEIASNTSQDGQV